MPFSNDFQTLFTLAEAYFHLGYSVIPLLGAIDPSRPKAPAIPWASFQQHQASENDYRQWFAEAGFEGIGIVTGRISKLIVLDFDSEAIFNSFRVLYPDLLETHTVRSAGRQLPHLYFKLPDHLHIASQKGQGIDLLSDGRYVVAPPTTIGGQSYKITRGGMPKPLTERDIRRLQAFLAVNRVNASIPVKSQQPATVKRETTSLTQRKPTSADLHNFYFRYAVQGRNEALFRTSLYARNTGWTLDQTQNSLVTLHSQQAAMQSHAKETNAQRQREALRTIQSAYSRPARPIKCQTVRQQGYLSNSVREALMQRGMTYVVRTIEGLRNDGIHPGQGFMAKEAVERLNGIVGRDSVWNALRAGENGKHFFVPPVSPPITANAVATDISETVSKKCSFEGGKNQYKPQGGRPAHLFRMPTNEELCDILGVKMTHSDPLEQIDLTSAQKTRMALQRELIKRRPGQYGKGWLARRLGVNKHTIATYNKLIPIHCKVMYLETAVNWSNIERLLPFDEPIQGAVLVTHMDKHYPALRTIASRLLAKGEGIILKQQTASYYWYGDEEPPTPEPIRVIKKQPEQKALKATLSRQNANFLPSYPFWRKNSELPQSISKQDKASKKRQNNFHKPLPDESQEILANFIYTTINGEGRKTMSLANARRIALMQSESRVRAALNLVQQRKTVINPTGFLMTILRSKYE